MSRGLNRREVLVAGAALLATSGCTHSEWSDSGEIDTAMQDRHEMLVDALLAKDLDTLVDAEEAELNELREDEDLVAVVPNGYHVLYTAWWWGYMKRQAARGNRPFKLPQSARDGLHRETPLIKDPLTGTYGII